MLATRRVGGPQRSSMLVVMKLSMVAEAIALSIGLAKVEVRVMTCIMLASACICWVRFTNASTKTSKWLSDTPRNEGQKLLNGRQYCIGTYGKVDVYIYGKSGCHLI